MLNDDMVQLDEPYEPEERISPLVRLDLNVARLRAAVSGKPERLPRRTLSQTTTRREDRPR